MVKNEQINPALKKSRLQRWAKLGIYFGLLYGLFGLTGLLGDMYVELGDPRMLPTNIGVLIGSVIGGAIMFGIAAVVVNGLELLKNLIVGVFK